MHLTFLFYLVIGAL